VITFFIGLDIDNAQQLYEAALDRAIQDGLDRAATEEDLRYKDGSIKISACLVMLLDPGSLPGCSIHQSWAESWADIA
jgi:hypothetical protein